ncbi:hypothetical protein [Lysinibacillus xylanilyticus]|uniref:hypothetical protein n=1 Tax=Lysinibacillus xylanilyticus TaxID=582475 RepID=UPI003D014667
MAKKRLRKKQQAKKNIQQLKSTGIVDKKKIKELKNDTQKTTALYKKEQRKITANERATIIKSFGYKVSDHSSKRYWSENRWSEWVASERKKQKRDERKKDAANENYLLIFWRDKTAEGFADTELIARYKYQYKYMDNDELLSRINHYLRTPKAQGAEIGTTLCVIVKGSQRKQYIKFMSHMSESSMQMSDINDWILVYEGKAKRYHDLLLSIHAVIRLLYDASERADFINTLIDKMLPRINRNMARRLAKDLGWRGF